MIEVLSRFTWDFWAFISINLVSLVTLLSMFYLDVRYQGDSKPTGLGFVVLLVGFVGSALAVFIIMILTCIMLVYESVTDGSFNIKLFERTK